MSAAPSTSPGARSSGLHALIPVDVQNDFLPGGALAVPDGNAVIPVPNRVQAGFERIVATQDWHPADHGSFAANHPGREPGAVVELAGLDQILWPVHCVQDTAGAALAAGFDVSRIGQVVHTPRRPFMPLEHGRRADTIQAGDVCEPKRFVYGCELCSSSPWRLHISEGATQRGLAAATKQRANKILSAPQDSAG